ncbi:MAG: tetratricopeptide repeat protein, partial [Trueperaceae bacterium]
AAGVGVWRAWLLVTLLAVVGLAAAQVGSAPAGALPGGVAPGEPPLPASAAEPFAAALAAAEAAVASPPPRHPDAPAWRTALATARAAVEAAPDHPATRRLLFRVYALAGWWVRAVEAAEELRDVARASDPPLDDPWADAVPIVPDGPSTLELVGRGYAELGFARYQVGALDQALLAYERYLAAFPDEPDALRWIGRIRLELDDPQGALGYWERLVLLRPDDEAARHFLTAARLGVLVGPAASRAFQQGLARYEAGDLAAAAEGFGAALEAAPSFADAHAWAGRVALEDERPAAAAGHYQQALALRPEDAGLAYFLRIAETQREHGVTAGRAFFDGLNAYESGALERAGEAFELAVAAAAGFGEAWAWLGRVRQEQGRFAAAEEAWARVLALDPGDERARGFLNLAREQRAYVDDGRGGSAAAAAAFAAGVAAFERAELVTAAARFREVVSLDPASALGWTWLGRVAFTQRDFALAADAYGRAHELDPEDDDVAWFAAEAAARAVDEAAAERGEGADEGGGAGDPP